MAKFTRSTRVQQRIRQAEKIYTPIGLLLFLIGQLLFFMIPAFVTVNTFTLFNNPTIEQGQTVTLALGFFCLLLIARRCNVERSVAWQDRHYGKAVLCGIPMVMLLVSVGISQLPLLFSPVERAYMIAFFIVTMSITSIMVLPWYLTVNSVTGGSPITCLLCNAPTSINHIYGLCLDCKQKNINEIQRVKAQLYRARKAGTVATLTPAQWIHTLQSFRFLCAYCQVKPYEVLEHSIPVSKGGGTTQENCIPSCLQCNLQKAAIHPEQM